MNVMSFHYVKQWFQVTPQLQLQLIRSILWFSKITPFPALWIHLNENCYRNGIKPESNQETILSLEV